MKLEGEFKATEACEAFQSFRNETNPGNVNLIPDTNYTVIGKNKDEASHYLLKIDEATPSERWVAVECGELIVDSTPPSKSGEEYVLAVSWQPSFCETKPTKPECESETEESFQASNLVLHGLWPQPRNNIYCSVSDEIRELDESRQWSKLPPIDLSQETRDALAIKMPGYASDLHLHEWYKHGTCYGATPEEYYQESLLLLEQVNDSGIRDLFVSKIDQLLSNNEIRNGFDQDFGTQAGEKVNVSCSRDIDEDQATLVLELKINLKGEIDSDTEIEELIQQAGINDAGCSVGEVDRAGVNEA
ncbi:MAG: hypothetical protein DSM107014_10735 [Gomphosphaeria aponina SAG 52.96 = DSM 107014]|uniref:Uncharacterized protein n=1 Tax=Gomphosphaeria aponina SAG 52.96 = DSM 107014 TaxID=1521640 RepID=A0A941GQB1_9CHRO|nr:hypothetical protein [Gomphosphaeria aponina SAG 52.96 = DSM 107014]